MPLPAEQAALTASDFPPSYRVGGMLEHDLALAPFPTADALAAMSPLGRSLAYEAERRRLYNVSAQLTRIGAVAKHRAVEARIRELTAMQRAEEAAPKTTTVVAGDEAAPAFFGNVETNPLYGRVVPALLREFDRRAA